MHRHGRRWSVGWLLLVAAVVCGCETFQSSFLSAVLNLSPSRRAAEEEAFRREYQETHSAAAMQWLLANCVHSGMTLEEVNRVLGEEGVREYDDLPIKTNGGFYRADDVVYRWGPDNQGHSVYLVFRDGRLVNFDPDEFREPQIGEL